LSVSEGLPANVAAKPVASSHDRPVRVLTMGAARKTPIPFPLSKDLTGRSVGRFLIRCKLGAGGMGDVYYADDTVLRRPVALKRVTNKLGSDPHARQQILHEAQRASGLSSEHIAAVHDVLEEDGEILLVMEYVEGETLRQRLQRPMTLEEFFEIATQCAEALTDAHEHGILHCDIKPENIMLTPAGQVKILDFGLAKHLPRSDRSSTLESGVFGGTPAYMAPEVLLEKLPDARSDIFSLGVVFYEMLTRKNPFFTGSFITTSERILHDTPASIRAINRSVPGELESVVMRAMAKMTAERYTTARELLEDLRRTKAGKLPANAIRAAIPRQHWRGKGWLLSAGVLLALVAVSFVVYRWTHRPPVLAERGWVLISDFTSSEKEVIPDEGVREGLTIALQQSRYVNVFPRSRAYETLQRMKRQDASRIDEVLGREICQRENLQVLLTGSVERMGEMFQISVRGLDAVHGNVLFAERERFDRKDQFFDKVDLLAKAVRTDLGESLTGIQMSSRPLAKVTTSSLEALQLYSQAKDARDQGKDEQIESLLKGALQQDPEFAMAHLQLGEYYLAVVGKNERAAAELQTAYQSRRGVTEREQLRIEAGYYALQEQYEDEAQALNVLVSLYPDDEEAHQALGNAYYDLNQLDKALREVHQVLRLNPASSSAYRKLVLYLAYNSQPDAAIAAYNEAEQRDAGSPRMHWGVGLAYLAKGDASGARREFQKIGHATETDEDLRELCLIMADLYEGKLEAAKTQLTTQLEAVSPQSGGLQPFRRYLLGRIHLIQGKPRGAQREADLVLHMPGTGLQVSDLLNAGILYARAGNNHKARATLQMIDSARRAYPSSSNQSSFHNLDGEIRLSEGKLADAENSFATAAQEYPQVLSHSGLARTYQAQRLWGRAAQEWEQVLRSTGEILHNDFPPDLAYAHLELGHAYLHMNQPDLARSQYEQAVRIWQHADALQLLDEATRELKQLSSEVRLSEQTPGT
jgi:eukaryotic-like serine/threonine-protein kinase